MTTPEQSRKYFQSLSEEKKQASIKKIRDWSLSRTPEQKAFIYLKRKARQRGMEFDLEQSDIVFPEVCPILGIPIKVGQGKLTGNSPSVDRVDNARGYTKDNIQIISNRANTMKNNATPEQLVRFADWVYENFKIT